MSTSAKRSSRDQRPPAPEPLPVAVPDSHTHLDIVATWGEQDADSYQPPSPTAAVVKSELDLAESVGIDRIVQVGVDEASSRWAVALAEADPRVRAAVALHPNDSPLLTNLDEALAQIDLLAGRDRVVALGETGMDFYRTVGDGRKVQEHAFRAHIEMANAHGKALMIHDRDAHADVLRVLDEAGGCETVIMHCFSGDAEFARECAKRGYYMSFAGNVTFKNAPQLREAAATCPPELMLVETDAPFMSPMPYRGRQNGPFLIPVTVRFLAEYLERDLDQLCRGISRNAAEAFGRQFS